MKLFLLSFFCFSLTFFTLNLLFIGKETGDFEHDHEVIFHGLQTKNSGEKPLDLFAAEENIVKQKKIPRPENKIIFKYHPEKFKFITENRFKKSILQSLESTIFSSKIKDIVIILYSDSNTIRGNMKDKILRIYDPLRLGEKETFAVFLHELGHYIDLYYFQKQGLYDTSHEFYSISWENTKIMRAGQTEKDFVSGYAATNAYEDFSESFLYFILHNSEFEKKMQSNNFLKRKYDFFAQGLFIGGAFQDTNFSIGKHNTYERDITKLDFSLENFLDYLKKSI